MHFGHVENTCFVHGLFIHAIFSPLYTCHLLVLSIYIYLYKIYGPYQPLHKISNCRPRAPTKTNACWACFLATQGKVNSTEKPRSYGLMAGISCSLLQFLDGEGLHEIISVVNKPPNLIPQILFGCIFLSYTPETKIIKLVPRFLQYKILCCPWYWPRDGYSKSLFMHNWR